MVFTSSIFAQVSTPSASINYESVNPKNGASYNIKRLKENINLFIFSFFPTREAGIYNDLTSKRLAKLKYVVDQKDGAYMEQTSIRYFTSAGQLTEYVLSKTPERKEETKQLLSGQPVSIEQLEKSYDDTTAEWRFLKQDADNLKIYISKL